MALSRGSRPTSSTGTSSTVQTGSFLTSWPATLEFLSMSTWGDGKPRELGKLSIFVDGPVWKCCLGDAANERYAFVSAPTPEDLLIVIEAALETDQADWRVSDPEYKKKKKR